MEELTVKDYAMLRKCSEFYVRKLITEGKLIANEYKSNKGRGGKYYMIPLTSLDSKLLRRYKAQHKKEEPKPETETNVVTVDFEQISASDRKEIEKWKEILNNWRIFREGKKSKELADQNYIEFANEMYGLKLSRRTLMRKWKDYNEQGETALLDGRGKHNNHHTKLNPYVWDVFEDFYLDQSQKTVSVCMRLTELQLAKDEEYANLLPLPSIDTFVRAIDQRIPVPVLKYYRFGEKVFRDECAPYIERKYDDLYSNDIWVTDNHTFDVMINKDDAPVRIYITGFLDVRSRKMVGWYVTDAPRSDATLYALRRGIEKYGVPQLIYSDNGREFLTHDIGGRGFRKSAVTDEHEPATILQRLGIEFRTALVRNARAKIIERAFRTLKENFSRMFDAYTGGTIAERPERLKGIVKNPDNLVIIDDFARFVDVYIQGDYNKHSSKARGMQGRCPDEVYAKYLIEQRVASKDNLNLMLLRNSKMQTVKRNGVMLKFYEQELWYGSDELTMNYIGERVYLRFNPDDLNEVRIYDNKDCYITTCKLKTKLSYFASKEEIAQAMRENRTLERTVKAYKKQKDIHNDSELSLMLDAASQRLDDAYEINPKVIVPIRPPEGEYTEPSKMAMGMNINEEPINWSDAIERLRKVKEDK